MQFTDDQIQLACRLNVEDVEWAEILRILKIPIQHKELFRGRCRRSQHYKKTGRVGFFTDTHAPFMHPNFIEFVYDTFDKWKVDKIICGGDIVDHHAISRHETEPEAYGTQQEFEMAMEQIEPLKRLFPDMDITVGNHDLIVDRQAKTLGMGRIFVKSLKEIYEMPSGWNVYPDIKHNNVLYVHGVGYGGKDGALNGATKNRMSMVMGHAHAWAGCKYSGSSKDLVFGLNAGCGIDNEAYAFAYGKHLANKPILGCGIIESSAEAYFIPMGEKYLRSNR